jgi:gluconolactonase
MKYILLVAVCWSLSAGCQPKEQKTITPINPEIEASVSSKTYPVLDSIQRIDPAINAIISPDAMIEILADGFEWSEGPLWLPDKNLILFSDIPNNAIFQWDEKSGAKICIQPSGYTGDLIRGGEAGSNGLLLDNQGRLVLCMHGDRRVARYNGDFAENHSFETIVDKYNNKRLNSPNDAVYKRTGELYFTDPPYGLEGNVNDPNKELTFQGVYRVEKSGNIQLLTDALTRPNGIAFSPDESKLYVANSDPERAIWMVYNVDKSGHIDAGDIFYDATHLVGKEKGLPDGLKVDDSGNVFATGPGGVWIFNPGGKVLGKIRTGQATSNCGFNEDKSVLYITADMYLMRVKLTG